MAAPVRWGLLSTARINAKTIEPARDVGGAELVAVASRDAAKAAAYAAEHGIPRAHGSYEALLADDEVEAVYISLPNGQHHEWTLRALEAGKHVLCEKPYSRRPQEVEEAFDARGGRRPRADRGVHVAAQPADPAAAATRWPRSAPSRASHASFGFALADQTNHRLDRPRRRVADGRRLLLRQRRAAGGRRRAGAGLRPRGAGPQRRPTCAWPASCGFADGLTATFACCFSASQQGLTVVGSTGIVHVPVSVALPRGHRRRRRRGASRRRRRRPTACSWPNVSAAIRGEGQTLLGRADALGQARTIEALYRSVGRGRGGVGRGLSGPGVEARAVVVAEAVAEGGYRQVDASRRQLERQLRPVGRAQLHLLRRTGPVGPSKARIEVAGSGTRTVTVPASTGCQAPQPSSACHVLHGRRAVRGDVRPAVLADLHARRPGLQRGRFLQRQRRGVAGRCRRRRGRGGRRGRGLRSPARHRRGSGRVRRRVGRRPATAPATARGQAERGQRDGQRRRRATSRAHRQATGTGVAVSVAVTKARALAAMPSGVSARGCSSTCSASPSSSAA